VITRSPGTVDERAVDPDRAPEGAFEDRLGSVREGDELRQGLVEGGLLIGPHPARAPHVFLGEESGRDHAVHLSDRGWQGGADRVGQVAQGDASSGV